MSGPGERVPAELVASAPRSLDRLELHEQVALDAGVVMYGRRGEFIRAVVLETKAGAARLQFGASATDELWIEPVERGDSRPVRRIVS